MKLKVLLLQGTLSSYNIPVYDIVSKNVDLTVAYTINNECSKDVLFKIVKLEYLKIAGFYFILDNFYGMCSKYDVVVFMPDLHYFSYCTLPFINRNYKVIAWSIGVRSSYVRRYDLKRKINFLDKIYGYIMNKSEAVIFYMKAPIEFWGNRISKSKIFIAHNTVEVLTDNTVSNEQRNRLLFIGTLYKEKRIYELIDAYLEAKKNNNSNNFLCLDIIGRGEEFDNIKAIIEKYGFYDSIFLHGPVYDELKLSEYFSKALLCISPDQAGLSVLKSMGYGVAYVTRENAITGGERLNIINNENGMLYKDKGELVTIIEDAFNSPNKYKKMGINAKKYYNNNATVEHMAQGFIDAINHVLNGQCKSN